MCALLSAAITPLPTLSGVWPGGIGPCSGKSSTVIAIAGPVVCLVTVAQPLTSTSGATIIRTFISKLLRNLLQGRPHPREQLGRGLAQHPARVRGQMLGRIAAAAEDVMVEHRPPRRALLRRQMLQRIQRVDQRIVRL